MVTISRRSLLAGFGAGMLVPVGIAGGAETGGTLYVNAKVDADGRFRVTAFDGEGTIAFDLPLPERGHAFTAAPDGGDGVIFARRPGTWALVIDRRGGAIRQAIASAPGRHFFGHGVYSRDGRLLYATENDYEGGRGIIGIYDAAAGYERLGEFPSHGIDPHDLRLLDDNTLVVANGGILTHPDAPRAKLNIPTMEPSLVHMDLRDGALLAKDAPPAELRQLSWRHLAVGRDGTVGVAMQYEGPENELPPLVGLRRPGEGFQFLDMPDQALRAMEHYCGSAASDREGRVLGVAAPRGDRVVFWDMGTGDMMSVGEIADGCGIAAGPEPATFLVSSGQGGVRLFDARNGQSRPIARKLDPTDHWDNHMTVVDRA